VFITFPTNEPLDWELEPLDWELEPLDWELEPLDWKLEPLDWELQKEISNHSLFFTFHL